MIQAHTRYQLEKSLTDWRDNAQKIALVPTMGALHDGHISLVNLALQNADKCVVSIFVNPTQFAPDEDLDTYPRTIKHDLKCLQSAGVHLVYTPDEAQIYPHGKDGEITAGNAAQGLESDFRPHFFDGVVNVVYRLFDQVKPDMAIFGEKDYQQLQVIREMVQTHAMPIEIIGAPTVRDEHGLALSSRNAYLSAAELNIAHQMNIILRDASTSLQTQRSNPDGLPRRPDDLLAMTKEKLLKAGFDKVDYVQSRWNRILAAAWIGKTRLIDNVDIII